MDAFVQSRELRPLTQQDFDQVSDLLYRACGISLQRGKLALVSSRLEKLVRRNGFDSFRGYVEFLQAHRSGPDFCEFIDTLTTNHSGFWREPEHFHFFRSRLIASARKPARVWSAACATGQEPYTISMCAIESAAPQCRIVATDISRSALAAAARGVYSTPKLSELPAGWVNRYFEAGHDPTGATRRVGNVVRSLVNFCQLNLLQPFEHLGSFDVIFCRNVMIYFDQQTRDHLIERLTAQLHPEGVLFTGHSETLLHLPPGLRYVQPATYRKT